jgi:hypothetical protein
MAGLVWLALRPPRAGAQEPANEEVVANLAAGRVAVLVTKSSIVIATAESKVEAGTLPPLIVPLGSFRAAVLLGPAEWMWPGGARPATRMDAEMRRAPSTRSHGNSKSIGTEGSDIEDLGLAFLEPLRAMAGQLHGRLRLNPQETFVEVLLADYANGYGPEVWSLRYHAEQVALRGEYYQTRVHRPEYIQLYPPDKGQPKTLVEARYPEDTPGEPPLLDLVRGNDPRLAALRQADAGLGSAAAHIEKGDSPHIRDADGVEFVRAAQQSVVPREARQMIAVISEKEGFQWVLGQSVLAAPTVASPTAPGAPTLLKKPNPQD